MEHDKTLNGKTHPSIFNIVITINGKQAITTYQNASAFNKQFVNTVPLKTGGTNRNINKHAKHLL